MEVNKINACDVFDDDNNGFIYGVEWDVGEFEYHNQWFKTKEEQEKCFNEILIY